MKHRTSIASLLPLLFLFLLFSTLPALAENVQVTWNASATPNVTYTVFRRTSTVAFQQIGATASLSWIDANVPAGSYFYAIKAVNNLGESSAFSAEAALTVPSNTPPPQTITYTFTKTVTENVTIPNTTIQPPPVLPPPVIVPGRVEVVTITLKCTVTIPPVGTPSEVCTEQ